jgi:FHA domain-containing protein
VDVLKIAVVGARAGTQMQNLSAVFGPEGGSIGRAKTNQLVLDDPERTVSRVHAQVVARGATYVIVDQGSNPLLHNGKVVGAGNEASLRDGDRLQIGSFELAVNVQASAAAAQPGGPIGEDLTMLPAAHNAANQTAQKPAVPSDDDPFADLLAGLGPAAPAASAATAAPSAAAASAARPAAPAGYSAPSAALSAAFDDPLGLSTSAPAPFSSSSSAPASSDPFADLLDFGGAGASAVPDGKKDPADDLLGSLPTGKSSSIDELFGLDASLGMGDPLGATPLGQPLAQPNTASSMDPLEALQSAPVAPARPLSDHADPLQQAYQAPRVVTPAPAAPAPQPTMPAQALAPPSAAPARPPVPVMPSSTATSTQSVRAMPVGVSASEQELLAAFLRGAKTTNNMPTQLTPELMERLGALLHTATHGTLQLLMSRQEMKQGFQSEVTMIMAEANNPLKFSPNAEVALAHLLGPRIRGFMDSEQAMTNAYADLRAHQFGVMVGMKAALAHVLQQFTPDKLEGKLTEKSKLDAIFTSGRKAKLWDLFCQLYTGIAQEAEDDFHTLFGRAFSKAYDEQMARFKGTK